MSTTITFPFTTSGNYTYDSGLIEVSGGVAKLKDLTPDNATFYADYESDEDGNWGGGVLSGTLVSGASVSGGQLDCTSGVLDSATYACSGNADFTQTGCIRFTVVPNYSGVPGSNSVLFSLSPIANEIYLRHNSAGGNLILVVRDSGSSFLINNTLGSWLPTSGQAYEFELNLDITNGATRLFIDGTQSGSTITTTGTRTASTVLYVGSLSSGQGIDAKFNDIIVYEAVQHTADYTPGESITPTRYDITNPTIVTNATFKSTELQDFSTTETVSGSDLVKYIIGASGQGRYVTGGSAANSDGTYAQSSTQSDMDSDITNIINARKTILVTSFLHSDDGSSTPELDLISVTYDAALEDAVVGTTLVNIESYLYNNDGPVASQVIEVRPFEKGFWNGDVFHQYEWKTLATTDDDGFFSGSLYAQPTDEFWEMRHGSKRYKFSIPSQAEVQLKDFTTWEVIED